jgi:alkaline phosphatase D
MAEEDLAFVVHLGDYFYEYGIDENGGFRGVPVPEQYRPECETLERYRLQHGLYKTDPDLQRAHQLFPWVIAWDDHEVQNDYAGLAPVGGQPSPAFTARRRRPTRRSTSTSRCGPQPARATARPCSTGA